MNDISSSDFENICRVCMLNCYIKYTQDNVIKNVYYKLTDMHFETNEELPQQICLKCFEKINEIHEFAFLCKQTHSTLLKCLNNSKNTEIKEEQEIFPQIHEIKIETHGNYFFENNVSSSSNIPLLKLNDYENCEFDINIKSETNDDGNINCFDFLEQTTSNIEVENGNESNDKTNLNDLTEGTNSSNSGENLSVDSPINNVKKSTKTKRGQQFYKCAKCSKSFRQRSNLNIHMRIHNNERPLKCNQCSKLFRDPSNFNVHMRMHNNERLYKCNECSKTFRHSHSLNSHMHTHNNESLFKCNECSKSFGESYKLKRHMLTHNNERPLKCNQCSKSFRDSQSLNRHMRTHNNDCPYKCNECSKSFRDPSNLNVHMRIHNNEYPYKCDQCSKLFRHSSNLNKHVCNTS